MCVNETYNKFHIDKYLSGAFPIQNGQTHGDNFIGSAFFPCSRIFR